MVRVRKTSRLLADGRELFYFDDPGTEAGRRADVADRRTLPAPAAPSTIRFDRLLGEWVAVAGHRQSRTYLPPDDECPLCPSTDDHYSEIPARDYDVAVFENRFPSFTVSAADAENDGNIESDGTLDAAPTAAKVSAEFSADEGFFRDLPGFGRCEVVCFTSDHDAAFSSLTPLRVRTVIEAWADRTLALSAIPGIEQVFCFENRGEEIGVTLSHPHGQIYGYPFLTPRTDRMLHNAREHARRTGHNLFADILEAEVRAGERIVAQNANWTALVPFAARWPLEVHLYPNRQVADLPALTDAERDDLSHIYLDVLRRMEAVYADTLPYIAAWHQAPVRTDRDLAYLHLEIFSIRRAPGKLKYLAGSESAMGAFINDVQPEEAARLLRDAAR
ncbi:MAG: galactose-1-phosphate uridylyltransferase [Acidothermaceae bacterium]